MIDATPRTSADTSGDPPAILFLCVHNAGRSQLALGWLRHFGEQRVVGFSGGSQPKDEVNPDAIAAMAEVGVDISGESPKPWTPELLASVDVVVTMGCGDACPVVPGKHYEDWEVVDPAGRSIDEVRRIRDDIRMRVRDLLRRLDVEVA